MRTLAGARMSPRRPQRIGRSFALLDQATRERLQTLLHSLPWVDGLITSVVIVTGGTDDPRYAEHAPEWLHHIWSEAMVEDDGISVDRTAEVMAAAVNHHRHIAATLLQVPEAYRPYLSGFDDPLEAAAEWADGFRQGVHLHPEMHELLVDQEIMPLTAAVLGLLHDEDVPEELRASSPFRDLAPERRAAMRRETVEMLPEIVPALHSRLLDLREETAGSTPGYVRRAPNVGRNDPCPCGSGRKYKKCCLGKD